MSDVFISYSRKERAFVRRLCDALTQKQRDAWVDWHDIHPSADWMQEITRAIGETKAFLFVMSPESIASDVCRDELDRAVEFGKRLVPLLRKNVADEEIPEPLRRLQWVFLRDQDNFEEGLATLIKALDTDIEWVRQHTDLLTRARSWDMATRHRSQLLRGRNLRDAENWMTKGTRKEPAPSELHHQYIHASRRSATVRLWRLLIGTAASLAVAMVLGAWALYASYVAANERKVAERQSTLALSRQLGAEASLVRMERASLLERSALLAIESIKRQPSLQNDVALRETLKLLPKPLGGRVSRYRIRKVGFANNGTAVVHAEGNEIRMEDIPAGTKGVSSLPHDTTVEEFVISPDSVHLASLTKAGEATLWNLATHDPVATLGETTSVTAIAMSPDGNHVATGDRTGKIVIWGSGTGEQIRALPRKLEGSIQSLAFDNRSRYIAAGTTKGEARVWSIPTGEEVAAFKHRHPVAVIDLDFSRDSLTLASACESGAYLWSLRKQEQHLIKRLEHPSNVNSVKFEQHGDRLVSAGNNWDAVLWDTGTLRRIGRLKHEGPVHAALFSPDDARILTASNDGTARLWDARTGHEIARYCHHAFVTTISFSPDGNRVVSGGDDGRVRVWDAHRSPYVTRLEKPAYSNGVIYASNGLYLARRVGPTLWRVRHTTTGRDVIEIDDENGILSLAVARDESFVATGSFGGTVRWWQTDPAQRIHDLQAPSGRSSDIDTLAISPEGTLLVAGSRDGRVRLWSTIDGSLVWQRCHRAMVMASAFSSDGRYVATGSIDSTARVWRCTDSGESIAELGHPHDVRTLAFGPDSKMLVTGCLKVARIWNIGEKSPEVYLEHQFPVLSVTFNPDGRFVATGGSDKIARVWEVSTRKEVSRMHHDDPVRSVAYVDDGKRLSIVAGRMAQTHLLGAEALINEACSRLTRNLNLVEWLQYIGSEPPQRTCPDLPDPWSPLSGRPQP